MQTILTDYITGETVPNAGAEEVRQFMEHILVDEKGYDKKDILVDPPIKVFFKGNPYVANLDLVVTTATGSVMAIRCVPGAIESYEREILAGARLIYETQIPFSVVTDGRDAVVWDTITGKPVGRGVAAVPTKNDAEITLKKLTPVPFPAQKKEREMIIFRSYDMDRTHRKNPASS